MAPWLLVAVVAATFFPVCGYEFSAWDDGPHVFSNPYFNPITSLTLPMLWRQPHIGFFIPLTYTTWAGLCEIARLSIPVTLPDIGDVSYDARVFHTANLVLHTANALLCYGLLRRLLAARGRSTTPSGGRNVRPVADAPARTAALFGALLFAVHPVQVESVAWISELKGLLSAFFALVALHCHFARHSAPRPRKPWLAAAGIVAFAAALLSKPSAIGLPLIAGALDCAFASLTVRAAVARLWPWAVMMGIGAWVGHVSQPPQGSPAQVSIFERPLIAGDTLLFYVVHLILPIRLGLDYGHCPQVVLARRPWIYLEWIVPAALGLLVWAKRRAAPEAAAGSVVFLAALGPVLGLVPFNFQAISTVADRYLYLAMLGPAVAVAAFLARPGVPGAANRATYGVVATALVLFAVRSAVQVPNWSDGRAIIRDSLRVNPQSWTAWDDLGVIDRNAGDSPAALAEFEHALACKPDDEQANRLLGMLYQSTGRPADAENLYRQTIATYPNCAAAHVLLGSALSSAGDRTGAEAEYRAALTIDPGDTEADDALGLLLLSEGLDQEAADQFHAVIARDPYSPVGHGHLAEALLALRQYSDSTAEARAAVDLCPNDPYWHEDLADSLHSGGDDVGAEREYRAAIRYKPDLPQAHGNLGGLLMSLNHPQQAAAEWQLAVRYDPNRAASHDSLADALAASGQAGDAIAEYRTALRLQPGDPAAQAGLTRLGAR